MFSNQTDWNLNFFRTHLLFYINKLIEHKCRVNCHTLLLIKLSIYLKSFSKFCMQFEILADEEDLDILEHDNWFIENLILNHISEMIKSFNIQEILKKLNSRILIMNLSLNLSCCWIESYLFWTCWKMLHYWSEVTLL